jgi:hypothetical protein
MTDAAGRCLPPYMVDWEIRAELGSVKDDGRREALKAELKERLAARRGATLDAIFQRRMHRPRPV